MLRNTRKIGIVLAMLVLLLVFIQKMKPLSRKRRLTKLPDLHEVLDALRSKIQQREKLLKEWKNYLESNKNKTKKLPGMIGIGVKKCGTDGLKSFLNHHILIEHPHQVYGETFFFSHQSTKNLDTYRNIFPPIRDKQICMEKTPIYFDSLPHTLPETIKSSVPGVKLLLIVCDPVHRVFSDYTHERERYRLFNDKLVAKYSTFEEYVDDYLPRVEKVLKSAEAKSKNPKDIQKVLTELFRSDLKATLITTGLYSYHILRWKRIFNSSDLLIIDGERFMKDPGAVIEEIQEFVGIPKLLLKEDFIRNPDTGFFCYRQFSEMDLNKSLVIGHDELIQSMQCLVKTKGRTRNGHKTASNEILSKLQKFYAPYKQLFFEEIQQTFNWM